MSRIEKLVFVGCTIALSAATSATGAEVAVRVRTAPGGPQIHVNGVPVPPRFFSGITHGSLRTGPEWREVSFDFTPPIGKGSHEKHALVFRFNHGGEHHLSGIRLADVATSEDLLPLGSFEQSDVYARTWGLFRPKETKRKEPAWSVTQGERGVTVTLEGEATGWWPESNLHTDIDCLSLTGGRTYRCTFRARSSARALVNVEVRNIEQGWRIIGSPPSDLYASQATMARKAGIRFFHVQAPNCFGPPDEPQDWLPMDKVIRRVIAAVPDALVVPRIEAYAPSRWKKLHPDGQMTFEDGREGRMVTVSSHELRRDLAAHFDKICRHLCETFPDNFAGILPLGQGTYEWYYDGCQGPTVSGYDLITERVWREWLAARGVADAQDAAVPLPELRHGGPNGALRDPASERRLIDFARFRQEQMADTVLELAAACRRATGGKKLVMFFYGYLFEFGMLINGAYDSGHYALSRVLASSDIDVLCAPLSYSDRFLCGSAPCMTAAESVLAAGKLWLNEDDCRTHLAGTRSLGGVSTPQQSIDMLRRNTAQALLRGFASWWTDIRDMGWHDDPMMWEIQQQLDPIEHVKLTRQSPYSPAIAAIVDEDSMMHLSGRSRELAMPLVYKSRAAFGRCGAPYGQYMLDDVCAGRVSPRLQFFLAAWSLTDEQRTMLRQRRQKDVTRVWCHAPGYIRPDGFDLQGLADLTGFRVQPVDLKTAVATPTTEGCEIGITASWGPKEHLTPLFAVITQPGDRVLATFSDGSPAVVLRTSPTATDAYVSVPAVSSQLIRALAQAAGVHLYTQEDAVVCADGDLASIHVLADGPLTVTMPRAGAVTDVFSGRDFGPGPAVTIPARKGETLLLRVE